MYNIIMIRKEMSDFSKYVNDNCCGIQYAMELVSYGRVQ